MTVLPLKSPSTTSSRGQSTKADGKTDILNLIQLSRKATDDVLVPPYVHPLVRRSLSSLSQRSLDICTESLGSETGSDGYSDIDDYFSSSSSGEFSDEEEAKKEGYESKDVEGLEGIVKNKMMRKKELGEVNYHCSINRRSPVRSFPPPLPSISRRDGPCVHMRPHRRDGRLVVEAVPVPSQNYLHCQRQNGRLLLSFIDTTFEEIYPEIQYPIDQNFQSQQETQNSKEDEELVEEEEEMEEEEEEEMEEEEEEEEVEVVDRGIVVEVKVRIQPQLQSRGMKVHKSSLVINKFVSGTPLENNKVEQEKEEEEHEIMKKTEVVCDAKGSIDEVCDWGKRREQQKKQEVQDNNKLLFTSKKLMNRQALLHQVRRCSYQYRPLFIWERCCIATS